MSVTASATARVRSRPARGPTAFPSRAHACRCRRDDQPVGCLRGQQQMVDADAVVLLPGAGLIVPEREQARTHRCRRGSRRSVRDCRARGTSRACVAGTARRPPSGRIAGVSSAGMTLKSPARTSGSSSCEPLMHIVDEPVHPFDLVGIFVGVRRDCHWADRSMRCAARRPAVDTTASMKRAWSSSLSPGRRGVTSSNGHFDSTATPLKAF